MRSGALRGIIASMASATLGFRVADTEVTLRSSQPDGLATLAGFYDQYPRTGTAPHLVLEIERIHGFGRGRNRGAQYPAFETSRLGPRTLSLSRFDAEGVLHIPRGLSEPVRGQFRVGDSANSIEAIVRIGLSVTLPKRDGLLLHASAVVTANRAMVFAGKSGAGKSTIATLLADGDRDTAPAKLADELIIVRAARAGAGENAGTSDTSARVWRAHVTPFIGSEGLPHQRSFPLEGIHFLAQASGHERMRMSRSDALRELLRHVLVYAAESETAARVLSTAAELTGTVPCYRLAFAKRPDVAAVLGIT